MATLEKGGNQSAEYGGGSAAKPPRLRPPAARARRHRILWQGRSSEGFFGGKFFVQPREEAEVSSLIVVPSPRPKWTSVGDAALGAELANLPTDSGINPQLGTSAVEVRRSFGELADCTTAGGDCVPPNLALGRDYVP